MAANRKLQSEIQQVLKKVEEGVALFDEIWEKVYAAEQQSLKEKYEADLKKEIKKLQRLRDQIKSWLSSTEIKDKTQLTELRKTIETKMELFKVCEKDTKTKAYSKEGLAREARLDPKEAEREEKIAWANDCLDRLTDLVNLIEADIEKISGGRLKSKSKEQIEKLENRIRKNKWHIARLEQIIKLIDNEELDPSKLDSVKDDVEYYIETAAEDDGALGVDDEFDIYEDLQLDEIRVVSAIDRLAIDGDSSDPTESREVIADTNATPTEVIDLDLSDEKSKVGKKAGSSLSQIAPPIKGVPTASVATKSNKTSSVAPSAIPVIPKRAQSPPSSSLAQASNPTAGASTKGEVKSTGPGKPDAETTVTPNNTWASLASSQKNSVTQQPPVKAPMTSTVGATTSSNGPGAPVPAPSPPVQAITTPSGVTQTAVPPTHSQSSSSVGIAAKVGTSAINGSTDPLTNSTALLMSTIPIGQSSVNPVISAPTSSSFSSNSFNGAVPNHGNSLAHNATSLRLGQESSGVSNLLRYSMLCQPESYEMDRQSNYVPKNAFPTHPSFPTHPLAFSENILFEKLPVDSLFLAFYYQQGTHQQFLAAKRLKQNSWRFHKKYMTWFQRHEEPKRTTDQYEEGTYVYFDYESGWCQRIKSEFKFEYAYLEDDLAPPNI